jgi:probable HAF family extracellular repeat protein
VIDRRGVTTMHRFGFRPRVGAVAMAWIALAPIAHAQNNPSFTGVGDLAGGAVSSIAEAISADASTVVGESESTPGTQAFRWTAAGGLVGIGDIPGGQFFSSAAGVSSNGSVIAGTGVDSSDVSRAFRWTQASGIVALNTFSCSLCDPHTFAEGISPNGLVVVGAGMRKPLIGDAYLEGARWSGGGTSIAATGHLAGGGDVSGNAGASNDGATLAGDSNSSSGVRGTFWRSAGGLVALPNWPGAVVASGATAISSDQSTIVGFANTSAANGNQKQAMRWTGTNYATIQLLGSLPGSSFLDSRALAATSNGAIIVGVANDENNDDVAFVWDATRGMRKLATVLIDDYGLAVAGWTLVDARGVSNVNGFGEFTIVGAGINPSGNPEGWVAKLSPTACNDGLDNDGDGAIDVPADGGCLRKSDRSEVPDCADGLDQDGDGNADYPADAQCHSATDISEQPDCADGVDDDGDGLADYPADPGCRNAAGLVENPACNNASDDDADTATDFPADAGCVAADDKSEIADCSDGLDNDGDGMTDFPSDSDCTSVADAAEDPQCSDRVDNEVDGLADYPLDFPDCASATDAVEQPACRDGVDNDGDSLVDFPADGGCPTREFGSEAPTALAVGDLLVVDRYAKRLFRVDRATGAQTSLSTGAQLTALQGVAVRASGEIVVADPAGLFQVNPQTGAQRRFSTPLTGFGSLQVVFDAAGDAVVLESGGLTRVAWALAGLGAETALLTLPVGTTMIFFQGDSLVRESSGNLLVTGFGAAGDGVFRVGPTGAPVNVLKPGFATDVWNDLALESNGNLIAVGDDFSTGPGVYRVNPTTGIATPLSTGSAWIEPTGVAVALNGELFVGDAGTCTTSGCTGASVVRVNPSTGARLSVWSGGSITGPTDLAIVTALPACGNGVDDDGDSAVDYPADGGCETPTDTLELAACSDGLDNDGDGLADFGADPGCGSPLSNQEQPQCSDGLDNDGDGKTDFNGGPSGGTPDPHCAGGPTLPKERPGASCGLGAEAAFALALILRARRRANRQ